jgi:predicted nucleotidyltransferase
MTMHPVTITTIMHAPLIGFSLELNLVRLAITNVAVRKLTSNLPVSLNLVYGVGNYFGACMSDYSLTPEIETQVCTELQKAFPNALGIYVFGSRVQGTANAQSDLDLAVLVAGYADPLQLFEIANQLADKLGYEVDLLDLRAASTVMQHQVITTGRRLWAKDLQADLFDVFVLNEKLAFDEVRAEQLNEIRETGRVYGK